MSEKYKPSHRVRRNRYIAAGAVTLALLGGAVAEHDGKTPLGAQVMEGVQNHGGQGVTNVVLYPGTHLRANPELSTDSVGNITYSNVVTTIKKDEAVPLAVEYNNNEGTYWLGIPVKHGDKAEIEGWVDYTADSVQGKIYLGGNSQAVDVNIVDGQLKQSPSIDGILPS